MATNLVKLTVQAGADVLTFKSASYSPTAINDIDPASSTTVDLSLSSISAAAAKNSDQVDLGATRAARYAVKAAIEWFTAVTAGGRVDFYWSNSNSSTVTDGNPGLPDGVDGAYSPSNFTVAEGVLQMQYIGSHVNNGSSSDVQIVDVGVFSPRDRYGQLVVVNNASATLCGTDDIESCVVFTGLVDDIQAAA